MNNVIDPTIACPEIPINNAIIAIIMNIAIFLFILLKIKLYALPQTNAAATDVYVAK